MFDPSAVVRDSSFLVTGGAGFIGSHLVDALLRAGARRVVVADNLRSGSWENVADDSRVERVAASFDEVPIDADYVFHLAAEKHNQSIDEPQRVLDVNVSATHRLISAASKSRVRKIVFTSTLYAYGRVSLPPMRENDLPQPRTVYGVSKLAGEHLLHQSGVRSTALRLFFTYGPRQFAGLGYKSVIVTNFERILRGEAPVINGDGEQSLDYVHVEDVVRALLLALSDSADGETMNIGSGDAISVKRLTTLMLEVAGSSLQPIHARADWTAGSHRVSDNTAAQRILGWSPSVALRDGLAGVYTWLRNR